MNAPRRIIFAAWATTTLFGPRGALAQANVQPTRPVPIPLHSRNGEPLVFHLDQGDATPAFHCLAPCWA